MEVDPSPISVHTILATAMGCMMYGSPERRFTPLCACLAKLNAFVMISTFLRCKNIQKTYSSKYFQKMYSVKSVFFINHLIRKLFPALILLPFIPFRLRN